MVSPEIASRYEALQLRLIVRDYLNQGFVVSREDARINVRFDAVVYRESDNQLVFIELLNSRRPVNINEDRVRALERAAQAYPHAKIDLRYIDVEAAPYGALLGQGARPANGDDFRSILKQRLPTPKGNSISNVGLLLELWAIHALALRTVAWAVERPRAATESVLDAYNNLLRRGVLEAPEQIDDTVTLDLFQIHDAVLAATQGAIVEARYPNELRKHIQSVRKQLRKKSEQLKRWNLISR